MDNWNEEETSQRSQRKIRSVGLSGDCFNFASDWLEGAASFPDFLHNEVEP